VHVAFAYCYIIVVIIIAFSALTLLFWHQEAVGCMVNCLERGADLHMAQRIPLPLTVSCFCKIQISFTFLVPADLASPGRRAIKRVCVCVCIVVIINNSIRSDLPKWIPT